MEDIKELETKAKGIPKTREKRNKRSVDGDWRDELGEVGRKICALGEVMIWVRIENVDRDFVPDLGGLVKSLGAEVEYIADKMYGDEYPCDHFTNRPWLPSNEET